MCEVVVGLYHTIAIQVSQVLSQYVLYIWHLCQDISRLSNKMWLEVRSRLVKKRLWLTKTIVTSFSYVGIKLI